MPADLTEHDIARARNWARVWLSRNDPNYPDAEDAEQYALIKLWKSAHTYDPTKGLAWESFVCMVVQRGVSEYMAIASNRRARNTARVDPASMDDARLIGHASSDNAIAEVEARWQLDLALEAADIPIAHHASYRALLAGATQREAAAECTDVSHKGLEHRLYMARPKFAKALSE